MLSNEDPLVIDTLDDVSRSSNTLDDVSTSFCRTALHIAAMCGDFKSAEKIVGSRPDLALKTDSQGFTPLHLASTRTSLRMVKLLVDTNSEACVRQDQYGRTPLHLAVIKDQIKIMKELIQKKPKAIHQKHDRDENLLHFTVKHNKFKALKLLVEYLVGHVGALPANPNEISVESKDNDGNTILHLAAEMKNFKIMKYLLKSKKLRIEINAVNKNNKKALDMLSQTERDDLEFGFYDSLGRVKKQRKTAAASRIDDGDWLKERMNALLLVATLIAGIACQAATNPPGGVWQEDSKVDSDNDPITFPYYLYHMFGYDHIYNWTLGLLYAKLRLRATFWILGLLYAIPQDSLLCDLPYWCSPIPYDPLPFRQPKNGKINSVHLWYLCILHCISCNYLPFVL